MMVVIGFLASCGTFATSLLGGANLAARYPGLGPRGVTGDVLGGVAGGVLVAVLLAIYFAIAALSLFAISEGITLFIDLEENSERTVALLEKMTSKS